MAQEKCINKNIRFVFGLTLLLTLFSSFSMAAISSFESIALPNVVTSCQTLNITVGELNYSNSSQFLPSVNFTAALNGTFSNSTNSSAAGNTMLTLQAPCATTGKVQTVFVSDNSSNPQNKSFQFFVTNATNTSFVFNQNVPPFPLNQNVTINATYFNGSAALTGNFPKVTVLNSFGQVDSNVQVYNLSNSVDAGGNYQINVSISNNASGQYFLMLDNGLNLLSFGVASAFSVTFISQNANGTSRTVFPVGSSVSLIAKIRNGSTPYLSTANDNITASVTFPNSSVQSSAMSVLDAVNSPGFYNLTMTAGSPGAYSVVINANISGIVYSASGSFNVQSDAGALVTDDSLLSTGGRRKVLLPGNALNFKVEINNNSNDQLVSGANNGGTNLVNCSTFSLVSMKNLATGANASWSGSVTMTNTTIGSTSVCVVSGINAPSVEGDFLVNGTVADPVNPNQSISIQTPISVHSYDPEIYFCGSDFPAGLDCPKGLPPLLQLGGNVTFEVKIRNFSNGAYLMSGNITNFTRIIVQKESFSGTGSSSLISNWTLGQTYFVVPSDDPTAVRIVLNTSNGVQKGPNNVLLDVNGSVGTLRGESFFMGTSLVVQGFSAPYSGKSSSQFTPQTTCNGTIPFALQANDIKQFQGLQGLSVFGFANAQHMPTGRLIDSTMITNVSTNVTDSNGFAIFNVTFNTSKTFLNGPYSLTLNVSYQGVNDTITGGFMCGSGGFGQDTSFHSRNDGGFSGAGGQGGSGGMGQNGPSAQSFNQGLLFDSQGPSSQIGPTQGFSFNLQNFRMSSTGSNFCQPGDFSCRNMGINGTVGISGIQFFNPSLGIGSTIAATTTLVFTVVNGAVTGSIFPANFSLSAWPQGSVNFLVNASNGSTPGLMNGGLNASGMFPGFSSTPFKVTVDTSMLANTSAVGDNVSMLINVSTNVSTSGANFSVKFINGFQNGLEIPATVTNATLYINGWNSSADDQRFPPGVNEWNVTFTIPKLSTGNARMKIYVNSSLGLVNSIDTGLNIQIGNFDVRLLQPVKVLLMASCTVNMTAQNGSVNTCNNLPNPAENVFLNNTGTPYFMNVNFYQTSGIGTGLNLNFSLLNTTYNVASKSGLVCIKPTFNFTNAQPPGGGPSSPMETFVDGNTFIAVLDNATSGVYDTVVFNNSMGQFTYINVSSLNSNQRNLANFNATYNGSYVSTIGGCGSFEIVNGTTIPQTQGITFLGKYPVNANWTTAYKVTRAGRNVTGATLDFVAMANLTFGNSVVNSYLPDAAHVHSAGTTDTFGVAFIQENVTQNGAYTALWKANATVGGLPVSEQASPINKVSQGIQGAVGSGVEIAAFNFNCGITSSQFLSSPQANLTANCKANYFNGTPVKGVNVSVFAMTNGFSPVSVTLYNGTNGVGGAGLNIVGGGFGLNNNNMPQNVTATGALSDDGGNDAFVIGQPMDSGSWTPNTAVQVFASGTLGGQTVKTMLGTLGYGFGSGGGGFGH